MIVMLTNCCSAVLVGAVAKALRRHPGSAFRESHASAGDSDNVLAVSHYC